jgi:hypothetical protein
VLRKYTKKRIKSKNRIFGLTCRYLGNIIPEPTAKAIKSEATSLLQNDTCSVVDIESLEQSMKKKILRSIMNITEKFLPTLDANGNRAIDTIKARFCVDGRGQIRSDYKPDEIESPTASTAAIFPVAQMAAAERRFMLVGEIGSAY